MEDRYSTVHPIIRGFPTSEEFLVAVRREMKIRCYRKGSIKQYMSRLNCFLDWFGHRPNRVTVETVREFLELLVDSGITSSTLSGYLAAIRMAFDKFCGRSHLVENGTNVRFVQKLLGHARLETTAIYTRTARSRELSILSPLDALQLQAGTTSWN